MRNTIDMRRDVTNWWRVILPQEGGGFRYCHHGMIDMFGEKVRDATQIRLQVTLKKREGAVQVDLAKPPRNKRLVREVSGHGDLIGEDVNRVVGLWLGKLFSKKVWDRDGVLETTWKAKDRYVHLPVWVTVTVLETM